MGLSEASQALHLIRLGWQVLGGVNLISWGWVEVSLKVPNHYIHQPYHNEHHSLL
jgi:hypothetical protein